MSILALSRGARAQAPAPVDVASAPVDVASANGRFVARAEKPKNPRRERDYDLCIYERKGDALVKQWGMPYELRGSSTSHLLSDDGATFVRVDDRLLVGEPIVEVFHKGQARARLQAKDLDLHPRAWGVDPKQAKDAPWLAEAKPALRIHDGRSVQILARDGGARTIALDATRGSIVVLGLRPVADFGGVAHAVEVEPGIPERFEVGDARVCVDAWSVPEFVTEDEPCPVKLKGKFDARGSQLVGFAVREDAGRKLVLLPLLGAPTKDHLVTSDITGFETTASLIWLRPGKYTLRLENCARAEKQEPREIEVLPQGLVASLHVTGGLAARDTVVRLFGNDLAQVSGGDGENPRAFFVPDGTAESIERLLPGELGSPAIREEIERAPGADLRRYELTWVRQSVRMGEEGSGTPKFDTVVSRVVRYDTTLSGAYRGIVDALAALKPPQAAERRYTISKDHSSVRVKTDKAGLFSAFGHAHELAARDVEGDVSVDPTAPERAQVRVAVGAHSLVVVDEDSLDDAKEIEATTRKEVLESARFPKITFTSTKVELVKKDGGKLDLRVTGNLDLHGRVRLVTLPVSVELRDDVLRAQATFSLKQSDYGISPTSAAGGTVKVDDKVKLVVDLRALAR